MAGQVFIGHGATVSFNSVNIVKLTNIGGPEQSRGDVEVTANDSNGNREYIPGLREFGNLALEGHFVSDDAGQAALLANYAAEREIVEVVITLPASANDNSDVTTLTFDAYVNSINSQFSQTDDTPASRNIGLKIAGAVTVATA